MFKWGIKIIIVLLLTVRPNEKTADKAGSPMCLSGPIGHDDMTS